MDERGGEAERAAAVPELPPGVVLPGPEPIRRSIRIACGVLGLLILALATVVLALPEAPWWGSLLVGAFASIFLGPAFLSRRARTEAEWWKAFHRAVHLSALTRALYLPGLGAMLLLWALRWVWPGFSLEAPPGPLLGLLIATLLCGGLIAATFANYYRAKAGV